jgi:hypothetical protein
VGCIHRTGDRLVGSYSLWERTRGMYPLDRLSYCRFVQPVVVNTWDVSTGQSIIL